MEKEREKKKNKKKISQEKKTYKRLAILIYGV